MYLLLTEGHVGTDGTDNNPWMGQAPSSVPEKPPKPGISHLCARLAGSAGRGGVAPPHMAAWWPGGRCFSAGATVRGSTHSAYSQCPGWRRLQDIGKQGIYTPAALNCAFGRRWGGEGDRVESGWSGSPDRCIHTGNSLKAGERFGVYYAESVRTTCALNHLSSCDQITCSPHLHFTHSLTQSLFTLDKPPASPARGWGGHGGPAFPGSREKPQE